MQQFFTWRFWAAILAPVALVLLLQQVVVGRDDALDQAVEGSTPTTHRVDLLSVVYAANSSGFAIGSDGLSTGNLELVLDAQRRMRIMPGTAGEVQCDELDGIARCAVIADLLGDAAVWFAIVPLAPRLTIELPPIVSLDGGYATLENGWQIQHLSVVERRCDTETESLAQFLREFGPSSTTVASLARQQIVAVDCGDGA
jgi:hypothetical protein